MTSDAAEGLGFAFPATKTTAESSYVTRGASRVVWWRKWSSGRPGTTPTKTLAVAGVWARMNPKLQGTARRGEWCVRLLGAHGRQRRARWHPNVAMATTATCGGGGELRPRWLVRLEEEIDGRE